jgi:DNA-binding NarL/FixJ family response regulator
MSVQARRAKRTVKKLRVFLVDDHPAVRKGLTLLLSREPDWEIAGATGNASEALERFVALKPDLGIIDQSLIEGDGLKLIEELRDHCPELKIVVFSMHNESHLIQAALHAGADGFVAKEEGTERLVEAIHAVMGGKRFLTGAMALLLA